jgi:antitoxin FitA
MAQALIRKIKDETLADYRSAAVAKGRSLEAELRELIERNRPMPTKDSEALAALSRRLREGTPASAARVDSAPFIRWSRDTNNGKLGNGRPDDVGD